MSEYVWAVGRNTVCVCLWMCSIRVQTRSGEIRLSMAFKLLWTAWNMWTFSSHLTAKPLNAAFIEWSDQDEWTFSVTTAKPFTYWAGWNELTHDLTMIDWQCQFLSVLVFNKIFKVSVSSAVHRSPSRSSGLDRSDSMLYGGSMSQLNGGGNVYLPDYSVRQLTHLQIIKVTTESHTTSVVFIYYSTVRWVFSL